jgi:hypothetical protein
LRILGDPPERGRDIKYQDGDGPGYLLGKPTAELEQCIDAPVNAGGRFVESRRELAGDIGEHRLD